ncbi:MAG: aromatic ring-hydroxylating dioxygenase subunit alpha [Acidimicrobiaceae bacterium]|nr:aromatic ring-hydroxylating dioxygenase subunit alpha [Acidimicrobiaceae bacterium]
MTTGLDETLTRRALDLVLRETTEMAGSVLPVPLEYYRDPANLESELALLRSTPLAIVPSAQIAEPDDFAVRSVLGASLLATRDRSGAARVLLNYCRHRGARPAEGCGNASVFTCPYHGWVYDPAGRLVAIPGAEGFDGVDRAEHGLVELPSEERHGFVWACLTAGAEIDVAAHLGPFDDELAQWSYGDYGYLTAQEFESGVNWKGALEAFAEGYHFPYVHGNSTIGMNTVANTMVFDAFGRHFRLGLPFNAITALRDDPSGSWDPRDNMGIIYWVYPALMLANSPFGVEVLDILPAGAPTRCVVRHGFMYRTAANSDEDRLRYQSVYERVHSAVRDEDFAMLPSCGDGVRNGQHEAMVLGRNEIAVQHMVRVLAEELAYDLAQS